MSTLQPCDIVFVRGSSWVSRAIRKMTRSPGEPRTLASHVGLIISSGESIPLIIEALPRGVVERAMPERYSIAVYRPLTITSADRTAILDRARSFVGARYGFGKVALHALDGILGGVYVFRRLVFFNGWPICSYVVAASYAAAGYMFGVEVGAATPDDILDFCSSRGDKYRLVSQ